MKSEHWDAVVVGGAFAGLSAALNLARARRSVLVVDAGEPRNRFATHSHGVLSLDGRGGKEILDEGRRQLEQYPSARVMGGRVGSIARNGALFEVDLGKAPPIISRRVLLATGVTDMLPDIPGLAERWGRSVFHCPYCHGYEISGAPIAVIGTHPMSAHGAVLIADWGEVTLFVNGMVELDEEARQRLHRRGVRIEETPVTGLVGNAPALEGIQLADGRVMPFTAAFIAPPIRQTSDLASQLGCEFDETPFGPVIRRDSRQQTTVEGVFAAGEAARFPGNISIAMGDGSFAGVGLHQSLIAEEAG